jgi:hypothetical protein
VAGCCECGDEPSGSCATELVSKISDKESLYDTSPIRALSYLFFSINVVLISRAAAYLSPSERCYLNC